MNKTNYSPPYSLNIDNVLPYQFIINSFNYEKMTMFKTWCQQKFGKNCFISHLSHKKEYEDNIALTFDTFDNYFKNNATYGFAIVRWNTLYKVRFKTKSDMTMALVTWK